MANRGTHRRGSAHGLCCLDAADPGCGPRGAGAGATRGVRATKRALAWPVPHQPIPLTWRSWPRKEDLGDASAGRARKAAGPRPSCRG